MGQKVHPIGFRLGVNVGGRHVKEWQGRWYADKDYTKFLHEDLRVRQMIMGRLAEAGVSRVDIERSANQLTVTIHAAKPGIVIGKSGVKVEELRKNLEGMTGKRLGGAEMSRREWEREGRVPLHTLRADIDFGQAEARTTFGVIGVKVWIYRGDVAPTARVGQGDGFT